MELSKRLYAVAGLVTEGASVADIGTDHGYVPIYLVERGIASKVIAMDVNQGPLNRARCISWATDWGTGSRPGSPTALPGSVRERWTR